VTTVWLARHGEVHNPSNVLYGRLPGMRMTAEGRRQASALAEFLAPRPIQAVYSSPMLRARRTAETILECHPELGHIRVDSNLQEVDTGWQGEPLAALEKIDWDFYGHPRTTDDESLQMISDRMHRWLQRVLKRHAAGEAVGVSHGDPILILAGSLRGLPLVPERIFPRPYIETGALYRLRFDSADRCQEIELLVPHAEAAA
jgi:broad specificity phosphatase PhoE